MSKRRPVQTTDLAHGQYVGRNDYELGIVGEDIARRPHVHAGRKLITETTLTPDAEGRVKIETKWKHVLPATPTVVITGQVTADGVDVNAGDYDHPNQKTIDEITGDTPGNVEPFGAAKQRG